MPKNPTLRIKDSGHNWLVCLVPSEDPSLGRDEVQFYCLDVDRKSFGPRGQFVSNYYVSTITKGPFKLKKGEGLCLDGGVPEWSLESRTVAKVLAWLQKKGAR